MNFGDFIRSLRKGQNLDIQTLSQSSGVEASTISRVENARTQVTLLTAIRLCESLGASVADVRGVLIPDRPSESVEVLAVTPPTLIDVEQFLDSFHSNREESIAGLADLLNRVAFMGNGDAGSDGGVFSQLFVPEDIHKLLLDSPFYRFEIQYPPISTASDLRTIYQHGGFLTPADIGAYIRRVRREKQVTLSQLEQVAKFSQGVLARLESPVVEHLKLADILVLDKELEQAGLLLSMYWDAYSFFKHLLRRDAASAESDMKLISIYVIACRWLQFMNPQDRSWRRDASYERLQ